MKFFHSLQNHDVMPYKSVKKQKVCQTCEKPFFGSLRQIFCSNRCSPWVSMSHVTKTPFTASASTKGAIAELLVAADLMKQGFEVYRALSPDSKCDLLAIKNNQVFHYEIRTANYYKSSLDGSSKLVYPTKRINGKSVVVITHSDNKIHYINN